MEHPRSGSGNGEDNVGIPDDLRCKRSDGKQWRCTAMSMPDKTVCEKHYIQAKRRAANSALRASLKKKRKLGGDTEMYGGDTKSDDFDVPPVSRKVEDYPPPVSGKKHKEKVSKNQIQYSPETPPMRNLSARNSAKVEDDYQRDGSPFEESWRSYKTPSFSAADSSRNRSQRSNDDVAMAADDSEDSSEEVFVGQTCHQCRQNDRERVTSCLKCEKRGYCDSCISSWYSNTPLEEIEKACPACRGSCNCKACLRGDNMIKVRIREIPVLDKLQYHYCLLSSVLPVIKKIHQEQCSEVELERKLRRTEIDLFRAKVNADEQMCCNFCRIPIVDYHRHCPNCSYDLCLRCCQDLRGASSVGVEDIGNETGERTPDKETSMGQVSKLKLNFLDKFSGWKANSDGSIPCPPKEYGGCGHNSLNLNRIFKMNWVAKLVKNVEEMVSGCKVYDVESSEKIELNDPRLCQFADREGSDDNLLYCPSSHDTKAEGIADFRRHWSKGEPVIVKEVFDSSSISSWDPLAIWRGIQETADEKIKDETRMVKALDCLDWSEVDIELDQFIKGYTEGRTHENGPPAMLKLKDWPSPGASEEFLMFQRPEFISKLPLLEYIHSRLGLLNVAAKLPHYSLQNDAGPKIYLSYGTYEELDRGNSVTNLHFKMRDMVYLLVHTCEVKVNGQRTKKDILKSNGKSEVNESLRDSETRSDEKRLPDLSIDGPDIDDESESTSDVHEDQETETTMIAEKSADFEQLNENSRTKDVQNMMIRKPITRPFPTVNIPDWEPLNDSADNFLAVGFNCNAPCSPCPVEYLTALRRYLPSNDLEPDTLSDDSDVHIIDAFSCDHFRMYEFKVRRCARGRSHDWTECPYAHPGEKARRRDPRKFHYSGSACPDFRKGNCKKGDSCEFAHGVFECWLHPTRYRTQPCKDGTCCKRRVCFFAHTPEQLRVLPQQSPRGNGSGSGSSDMDYFGSPIRYRLDYVSSPTSILASPPISPPSDSPPTSPSGSFNSVSELTSSVRNLQIGKAKMGTTCSRGSCFVSPRSSMLRPGSPLTPTRTPTRSVLSKFELWESNNAFEEPAMERVESGRDLRTRMYAKLSEENSLDLLDPTGSGPDVGWVSELVGY